MTCIILYHKWIFNGGLWLTSDWRIADGGGDSRGERDKTMKRKRHADDYLHPQFSLQHLILRTYCNFKYQKLLIVHKVATILKTQNFYSFGFNEIRDVFCHFLTHKQHARGITAPLSCKNTLYRHVHRHCKLYELENKLYYNESNTQVETNNKTQVGQNIGARFTKTVFVDIRPNDF